MMFVVASTVEWAREPSAQRWRAHLDHGDVSASEAGGWAVNVWRNGHQVGAASGYEQDGAPAAKLRALAVYEAMTCQLKEV